MRRVFLAFTAAGLVALVGILPAMAQVLADPPQGTISDGRWAGSQFDDTDLKTGEPGIRDAKVVTVEGKFKYSNDVDRRWIESVTASASDPGQPGCAPPSVGEPTFTGKDTTEVSFQVSLDSTHTCNVTTRLTVTAETGGVIGLPSTANLTADISFDAPASPVTKIILSVEDTETKKVNVSWTLPDDAEPDTTYFLERAGPDAGDEPEWTTIAPAEPEDPPEGEEATEPEPLTSPITDTVTTDGVYLYRVVAERPEASSADSDEPRSIVVAGPAHDVRVGEPPPTTTVTQVEPSSPTTISTTRVRTAPSRNRISTRTRSTPGQPSPPTTVDTGFEESLPYELDGEPGELAAEGQSVLNTEGDSSIIGPGAVAAALLVMVGWAGHVVYFRRLAAQF